MIVARKFIISGLVQGVGYRFFVQRAAARHQVRGYVKNLADGRVEAFVQGDEKSVEDFKHDLIAGPTHSNVEHLEEMVVESSNLYSAFRIER
ncbi:MAG: acylphosphatase [Pyrinomonadaceae bacterium]|nr:acylphosphatase [Pyrinomonadaceae bacterium]